MPRGKNTKEYQTVKKSYPNLSDAIANVIEWTCGRLLAAGLITDGQRAEASNGFVSAKNRASTVTGFLLNKIEQDKKYFQMLVDVLQQDMDTFGTVLEQMGVTVDDDSSRNARSVSDKPQVQRKRKVRSAASGSDLKPVPTAKRKKKECGAASPTAFSDDLSPTKLVSWLSQQFQAKGLTLDPSLEQKLIDGDINGEAFMDLEDSDLIEMGFTKGQRMKIVKIIQSIKGSKEENGSSQTEAASKPVQTVKATSSAPGDASGSKGSGAGDLSPSLKRPTESDVLQRFHADLNSSITDPHQFAAELIQHEFTTKLTADNKMPSGESNYCKVGNLLGIVDSHIRSVSSVSPEKVKETFLTLLLILRNKLGLRHLAQKMETECYGTQQAYEASSEALSGLNGNAPSTGRGSEPAPKRRKTDYEGGGGSAHGSSRGASAANTMSDNLPTLPTMLRILLPMSSQWMNIGTMLSLKHGRLTAIETRCRGVPDNCLREMLNEWLQQVNPRPTKSALVNAVETYNPSLAEKISACENSP